MSPSARRFVLAFLLLFPGIAALTVLELSVRLGSAAVFMITMGIGAAAWLIADRVVYGPVMDRPRPEDRER